MGSEQSSDQGGGNRQAEQNEQTDQTAARNGGQGGALWWAALPDGSYAWGAVAGGLDEAKRAMNEAGCGGEHG